MKKFDNISVSIALATFNGEKYLAEQLHSILSQTRPPNEIILYDDNSSDSTVNIAHEFAETAKFKVKIFVNESNVGYSQNFSRALEQCSGDIVFLCDQDDVWLPNKIEIILNKFNEEPNAQLLIHDLEFCKEDLSLVGQTKIERMEGVFDLNQEYIVGMATAVRSPFLKICLPIPISEKIAHDGWLHKCAQALGCKVIVREVLALYRRHSLNATAGWELNVDFVTIPDHFTLKKSNSLSQKIKCKSVLKSFDNTHITKWMNESKDVLVLNGYTNIEQIDSFLEVEANRTECFEARKRLLCFPRWKRLFWVVDLYRRGGYRFFSGWKSALKDVILN